MEFLVQLETTLPADMPEDQRLALLAAEAERGAALRSDGTIQAIWRLPGKLANVGVWQVPTTEALHAALISLPLSRWMIVDVMPLARHSLMDSDPL